MGTCRFVLLTALLLPTLAVRGQEKGTDTGVYTVEFNIHDGGDTGAKAGRRYIMMIDGNEKGVFRAGQKVPYATGSFQPAGGSNGAAPMVSTQFNYAEIGVNIDCRLNDSNGKVRMKATLDMSTMSPREKGAGPLPPNPTIGQVRMEMNALVTPGRPTTVASIDDPVTGRKLDVQVTITQVI